MLARPEVAPLRLHVGTTTESKATNSLRPPCRRTPIPAAGERRNSGANEKAGALIAWQQKRLADIQLRHDLFDRRYAVYNAGFALILDVRREAKVSMDQIQEFTRRASDTSYIFDDSVAIYMEMLRREALRLWGPCAPAL